MFYLLDQATAVGPGNAVRTEEAHRAFHLYVDGTTSPNVDVDIEVSNLRDGPWVSLHTFNNITTSNGADTFTDAAPFAYVRANLTNTSGNGEMVTVTLVTSA